MIDQIVIVGTILAFITIGLIIKRSSSSSIGLYSISRDELKWFPISAGISMTYAGGAALLNTSSLGYSFGWYPMVDPLALCGGVLIVIILIKFYRKDRGVTISDLLAGSDKKLSFLVGLVSNFVFILVLAAQFVALSKLLAPYFSQINTTLIIIIPSTLIFSYVFLGGFTSVTKTDILQLIFVGIFFILPMTYYSITKHIPENGIKAEFSKMPLNLIILLSISLVYLPVSQDINIRVKSAKSNSQAVIGLVLGAFFYTIILACSTIIGISLAKGGIVLEDTETAYSMFFINYFPKFGFVAIVAALAAIVSSLDSFALNSITSISNDILLKFKFGKKIQQNNLIKIAAVIVYILAITIALYFNEILFLILTSMLVYISTLLPLALGKKLKIDDTYLFISSILLISTIIIIELLRINIELKAIAYPLIGFCYIGLFYFVSKVKNR